LPGAGPLIFAAVRLSAGLLLSLVARAAILNYLLPPPAPEPLYGNAMRILRLLEQLFHLTKWAPEP
jgi:hypothetical protein